MGSDALRLSVGLLPVALFLVTLILLDSYKLVRLGTVLRLIAFGGLAAILSWLINSAAMRAFDLDLKTLARYVAPAVEETIKGAILVAMIRTRRVGFLVDAAIFGFAVGAGFALVENAYYLRAMPDSPVVVWIVRGFGTAVMHGGVTAIFGIVSKTLAERRNSEGPASFAVGWLMAVVVHTFYNHFFLNPVLMTGLVLASLVPLFFGVFQASENALRSWLNLGFDTDVTLLEELHSGSFSESPIGRYLHSLKERFPGEIIADMVCYVRLHVELAMRAKGILMMRENGIDAPLEPEIQDKLKELKYLEGTLGPTGRLALAPILHQRSQDIWQIYMLNRG